MKDTEMTNDRLCKKTFSGTNGIEKESPAGIYVFSVPCNVSKKDLS